MAGGGGDGAADGDKMTRVLKGSGCLGVLFLGGAHHDGAGRVAGASGDGAADGDGAAHKGAGGGLHRDRRGSRVGARRGQRGGGGVVELYVGAVPDACMAITSTFQAICGGGPRVSGAGELLH